VKGRPRMRMSRRRDMPTWLRMVVVVCSGLISAPILLFAAGTAISRLDLNRINGVVPLINGYQLHSLGSFPRSISTANGLIVVPDSRFYSSSRSGHGSLEVGRLAVHDPYVVGTLYHHVPDRHGTVTCWFILDTVKHEAIEYHRQSDWKRDLLARNIEPAKLELQQFP
jgi:hypothetical protein